MLALGLAAAAAALLAAYIYLLRERQGPAGVALASLRVVALLALVLLLVNPVRTSRVRAGGPTVLLDASLSMQAAGGRWAEAVDSARARASGGGVVLRFASGTAPFDTSPPAGGGTRLREALAAARARGGPLVVVTDGEVEDAASLPPSLTPGIRFVVLPRDTAPDAALLAADAPPRVQRSDSVTLTVTVGTWGTLPSDSGRLTVSVGPRRLATTDLALPPPPGSARRRLALPPGALPAGTHVLRVQLSAPEDAEPRDDERFVIIEVSEQPAIVVIGDAPDWEVRFLVSELADVSRTPVRGYARVRPERWVDMRTLRPLSESTVRAAVRGAGLLVVRGPTPLEAEHRGPRWRWLVGAGAGRMLSGDWYIEPAVPTSPLAGRLAGLEWDSLPPLTSLVLPPAAEDGNPALTARQGRRGPELPVLWAQDSAGVRIATTGGEGMWRWRFRGGAGREAYRSVLAAGIDWLLAGAGGGASSALTATGVVQRGTPVVFRWSRGAPPDSLEVILTAESGSTPRVLRFDEAGTARLALEPGIYRWSAPDAGGVRGVAAVEPYSDELPPRSVMAVPPGGGEAFLLVERPARDRWWLFVVAIIALAGEWLGRQRRGLP